MHPGDVVSGAVRGFDFGDDLVEGERRGIDHPCARRGSGDDLRRHQRSGIETDRAGLDEAQTAQRDEVGGAGPGADEMHRHFLP